MGTRPVIMLHSLMVGVSPEAFLLLLAPGAVIALTDGLKMLKQLVKFSRSTCTKLNKWVRDSLHVSHRLQ
jgi:hypothetical protein